MDPVAEEPPAPKLSPSPLAVVVTVRDQPAELARCLAALRRSEPSAEMIIVDDASTATEAVAAAARAHTATLHRMETPRGPAAARNAGARLARAEAELILFVNADILVPDGAPNSFVALLQEQPDIAAANGSLDDAPEARNLLSQLRHLQTHFRDQRAPADTRTFWPGCGVIRRAAFEEIGGFDEHLADASVEGADLGVRLRAAGHRLGLRADIQAKALGRWRAAPLLRHLVRGRALPWARRALGARPGSRELFPPARLAISGALALLAASWTLVAGALDPLTLVWLSVVLAGAPAFAWLSWRCWANPDPKPARVFGWSAGISGALGIVLLIAGGVVALLPLVLVLGALLLHLPFLLFLQARRGWAFAVASAPLVALWLALGSACWIWALASGRRAGGASAQSSL